MVAAWLLVAGIRPAERPEENWPQWRGPNGLGLSAATDYVEEWAPDKNIAWKTSVPGRGHSSPIVWGNKLFITTSIEGERVDGHAAPDHLNFDLTPHYLHPDSVGVDRKNVLKVLAYDARAGTLLWEHTPYNGLMYDNRHRKNTYASGTMRPMASSYTHFSKRPAFTPIPSTASLSGPHRSATSRRRDSGREHRRSCMKTC